jgi:hypothetical protein
MLDKSGPEDAVDVSSVVVAVLLESTTIGGRGGTTPLENEEEVMMGAWGVGKVVAEDAIVVVGCSCCCGTNVVGIGS